MAGADAYNQGGGTAYASGDAVPPHSETAIATYNLQNLQLVGIGRDAMQQFSRIGLKIRYKSTFNEVFELKLPRRPN